jgi:hypothetical protein
MLRVPRAARPNSPRLSGPRQGAPGLPAGSLGEPGSGGRNLVSKGSTKMTAMNDEPHSPSDMGSIVPARRLPLASPTAGGPASPISGGPAGFPRGRRATRARGRVSKENALAARQYCGRKDAFRGTENKPLRAISNRKSNDSRKLATPSEPITSKFLIATKMHFSEEKAKRE